MLRRMVSLRIGRSIEGRAHCCSPGWRPLNQGSVRPSESNLKGRLTVVDADGIGVVGTDKGDVSKRPGA